MRVRRESSDGDYEFGRGALDFHVDSAAGVAQNIKTRLFLFLGEWFLDLNEGTPWLESVLGTGHEAEYAAVLRARILGSPGVREIVRFEDSFDREARRITVSCEVSTLYGNVSISETVPIGAAA